MSTRKSSTDRVFDSVQGTNITDYIYQFQECMVQFNNTGFSGGNPDLGGIGVIISLTILCVTCAVGCSVVIAMPYISKHKKWYKVPLRQHPVWCRRISSALLFTDDAFSILMSAVLDSVLFLSLTVHIAFVIAYLASDSLATEVTGGNSPGGEIYNEILLLFTTHITLCPCLAIMNTPHQWKEISRRGFRLLTITAIVIMNGIPIIRMFSIYVRDLQVKLDSGITPIESGCVTVFLWKINSWSTEVLIAIASWIICVVSLLMSIIRQLRYELRKPESRCSTLLQLLRIPNPVKDRTTTTPPEVDTEAQSSTQPPTLLTKILKILSLTVYTIIYIYLQALPLYYLWRIRWMRRHVRSIIQPPSPSNILYPPFADLQSSLAEELKNWDNDDWSFGQILTLSLWSPALLEFFYILIAGEDRVLTGRLPENWKAVEDLNSKAKHDIENDDEGEEVASQATPKTTPEKTPGQTTAET